jgi:hypothetical protein
MAGLEIRTRDFLNVSVELYGYADRFCRFLYDLEAVIMKYVTIPVSKPEAIA